MQPKDRLFPAPRTTWRSLTPGFSIWELEDKAGNDLRPTRSLQRNSMFASSEKRLVPLPGLESGVTSMAQCKKDIGRETVCNLELHLSFILKDYHHDTSFSFKPI